MLPAFLDPLSHQGQVGAAEVLRIGEDVGALDLQFGHVGVGVILKNGADCVGSFPVGATEVKIVVNAVFTEVGANVEGAGEGTVTGVKIVVTAVAADVGLTVGEIVGLTVGVNVGSCVGVCVGVMVGENVGEIVVGDRKSVV